MPAELYLHRVSSLPSVIDPATGAAGLMSAQLQAVTLVVADQPALATLETVLWGALIGSESER